MTSTHNAIYTEYIHTYTYYIYIYNISEFADVRGYTLENIDIFKRKEKNHSTIVAVARFSCSSKCLAHISPGTRSPTFKAGPYTDQPPPGWWSLDRSCTEGSDSDLIRCNSIYTGTRHFTRLIAATGRKA